MNYCYNTGIHLPLSLRCDQTLGSTEGGRTPNSTDFEWEDAYDFTHMTKTDSKCNNIVIITQSSNDNIYDDFVIIGLSK